MPIRFMKPLFKQISAFVDRLAQESSIQSSELFNPPIGQQSWSHEESSIELSRIFSWSFLFPSLSVFKTVVLFYIWARKLKQAFGLRPFQVCGCPKDKVSNLHFGCQDQNDEIARKASKVWSWKARMRLTPCLYALTLELGLKTCLELVGSKRSGFSQKNTKTEFVCHACHCHHPCSLAICDHAHVAIISHPKGLKNDIQYVFCPILVLTMLWLSFSESSFQSLQSLQ